MATVTVVGSANLDVILHVQEQPKPGETILAKGQEQGPGGKGFNQAVAAHKAGADTRFIACLGDDSAGEFLRSQLLAAGMSDSHLSVDPNNPTGTAYILLDAGSENSIVVNAGANAALSSESVNQNALGSVVLMQLEVPVSTIKSALETSRTSGAVSILNAAPALKEAAELFPMADVVVVNETEAGFFGGVSRILAQVRTGVVLTRGARGAQWFSVEGGSINVPAFAVDPVDTTGAGDAFCGALAAELARGADMSEALVFASAAGALATTQVGAQNGVQGEAQVRELMDSVLDASNPLESLRS